MLFASALTLKPGAQLAPEVLSARLVRMGYTRCSLVEGVGQFSVRGGILDVFSPAADQPVRVEFFGDEVDTMGFFDLVTQRRTENAESLVPVSYTHLSGSESYLDWSPRPENASTIPRGLPEIR